MSFNYKQSLLINTIFVEVLALSYYCSFNKLEFKDAICNRKKEDLGKFPDFEFDSSYLEVVRATDEVEGKQKKDITDVFGKQDSDIIVLNKNEKSKKYKGTNSHHIEFGRINGITYAMPDLRNYHSLVVQIENAILKKYENCKSRKNEKDLDLFVISCKFIDNKYIEKIFNWYKNNVELNSLFANVYIRYLSHDNEAPDYVAKMNKEKLEKKPIKPAIKNNEIAELIFKCGWLDEKEFLLS